MTNSCVFETTEDGPYSIKYVRSQDDGFTWNSRTPLYTANNGADAGAPQIINLEGTLVADFMTNEDGGTIPGVADGGEMKVITSGDGGQTWSESSITGSNGSHWPGLYAFPNSTSFLALYSHDDVGLVTESYSL